MYPQNRNFGKSNYSKVFGCTIIKGRKQDSQKIVFNSALCNLWKYPRDSSNDKKPLVSPNKERNGEYQYIKENLTRH